MREWFSRQGCSAVISKYRNVVNADVSGDALGRGDISKGNNSKSIELQSDDPSRLNPILVLHVSEYKPSRQRTMQEVRPMIESSMQQGEMRRKAQKEGGKLLADAKNGVDMEKLAKDNQLELIKAGYIKRSETGHDVAIVRKAFGLSGKAAGTSYGNTDLTTGGVAIIAISGEKPGDPSVATEQEKKYLSQFIQKATGSSEHDVMVKMIR